MAKTMKPKALSGKDGAKAPPNRKTRKPPAEEHVLRKPEVMEAAALEEATRLMTAVGKDWEAGQKRLLASLARKYGVTESFVYASLSRHVFTKALEVATGDIVDTPYSGHATDD